MENNKNKLLQKKYDLQQKRADQLDKATKFYGSGDTAGFDAAMAEVKSYNSQLETLEGLIAECDKSFGAAGEGFAGALSKADDRVKASGASLVDQIRSTEKYAEAWIESVRKGIPYEKGASVDALAPLYDADKAIKSLAIGGGDSAGSDGGFLVPVDFDLKVRQLLKEYIDLSSMVNVERVNTNTGWRVVNASGTPAGLVETTELGQIKEGPQPKYSRIGYTCRKFTGKLIISNELLADASGLLAHLAAWWTPQFVATKNRLILTALNALSFSAITGDTDAEQIKALKRMLNVGLNSAHSKRASILTNGFGYDVMDNWVDGNGRPLLQPDLKGGDFDRFKRRPVIYADEDLIPNVSVEDAMYNPLYIGDFKSFGTLFLRDGIRVKSTDVGGNAWDTDSTEIRCINRMDFQTVDAKAVKRSGFLDPDAAAAAAAAGLDEEGEEPEA